MLFFLNGFVQTFSSQSKAAEFEPIITQVVVTAVAMSIAFLIPLLPLGEAGTKMGAIPGYGSAFISIYLQTR